jgi:VanZ family protein
VQPTRQLRTSSLIRWAAAIAWMAFMFYLSAQSSLPSLYNRFEDLLSLAGHFVEYAVLALLLRLAIRGFFPAETASGASHAAYWAFVLAVAYGITDELHQHFVPGRHMDPLDLLMDAIGAAAALWVAGWVMGRRAANPASDAPRSSGLP